MMLNSTYSRDQFKKQSEEFRIGVIISDGMWYTFPKWRKHAKVSEEALKKWIDEHIADGSLIVSDTKIKSYRFSKEAIVNWYYENNLTLGDQIIDFMFPPRIWGDKTETEGFIETPLREIGIVTFICSSILATEVTDRLKGIARVRETNPNEYKAYCLDSSLVKTIVEDTFKEYDEKEKVKVYGRVISKRRELVDFSYEFKEGLLEFYKKFAKTFVKRSMDTISIYLPDQEDQDTQIVMWVITAIEKYDETSSTPFSGYLNSVLNRWPYDLPNNFLGPELSAFQRQKAKAIQNLKDKGINTDSSSSQSIDNSVIANEMQMSLADYSAMEERNKIWAASRNATTLTWGENNDEKKTDELVHNSTPINAKDKVLANRLSQALIRAALNTEYYDDAFAIISQMDASELNLNTISEVSEEFIQEFGAQLGIDNG